MESASSSIVVGGPNKLLLTLRVAIVSSRMFHKRWALQILRLRALLPFSNTSEREELASTKMTL